MNTRERHRLDRHKVRVEELRLWRNARESPVEGWRLRPMGGGEEIWLGEFWPEVRYPPRSRQGRASRRVAVLRSNCELWLGGEGSSALDWVQRRSQSLSTAPSP